MTERISPLNSRVSFSCISPVTNADEYSVDGGGISKPSSTVIFLAMTYCRNSEKTRVMRDTLRIENMMTKYENGGAGFVSVSMAGGFEDRNSAHFLWSNFTDARFYDRLRKHILSYPRELSGTISCVILDYVNMPGIYSLDSYLGRHAYLLDFFKKLTYDVVDNTLRLAKDGCIYIPLTPSFYDMIESKRKFETSHDTYVISFLMRTKINRHPLVASDLAIADDILLLGKNIEDSIDVLGKKKNSTISAECEEVFLLLERVPELRGLMDTKVGEALDAVNRVIKCGLRGTTHYDGMHAYYKVFMLIVISRNVSRFDAYTGNKESN